MHDAPLHVFYGLMKSSTIAKHLDLGILAGVVLVVLLSIKFLLPVFLFPIPLGYDPGIYRFLFLKYAETFPLLPELPRWAGEHPPGLFLIAAPFLDLGMPVADGFKVLQVFKNYPPTARIPIIILTGNSDPVSVSKAQEMNVTHYLMKPFNSEKLSQLIQRCI